MTAVRVLIVISTLPAIVGGLTIGGAILLYAARGISEWRRRRQVRAVVGGACVRRADAYAGARTLAHREGVSRTARARYRRGTW